MELDEAIEAVKAGQAAVDAYLDEHPGLPSSNRLSIENGLGQTRFVLAALQRSRGAEEAEATRLAEREAKREAKATGPRYDDHDRMRLAQLVKSGALPADATLADAAEWVKKRQIEMQSGGGGKLGGVPKPAPGTRP